MATFQGYIVMIIGLSIILAMIGVQTTSYQLINLVTPISASNSTSAFSIDASKFNTGMSVWFGAIWGIFGLLIIAINARAYVGGTFGLAETIKVNMAYALITLVVADLIAILIYTNNLTGLGSVVKYLTLLIYLPLAVGAIISATDYIGGGR